MTSGRPSRSWISTSPPADRIRAATQSAARARSSACAGSALTEGIAISSESSATSASWDGSTRAILGMRRAPRPRCRRGARPVQPRPTGSAAWDGAALGRRSRSSRQARSGSSRGRPRVAGGPTTHAGARASADVADACCLGEHAELLEALVLDLADALACDVERAADLVEGPRLLAVEAVAHLEHLPLSRGERVEDRAQRIAPQAHLRGLLRERLRLVGEEVAELRLLLVADRLLQRDRGLRAALDVLDLLERQAEVDRDLLGGRLAGELGAELPLRPVDLVQLLDDVDRHADRAALVRDRAGDRLADPPRRVRRELEALAPVELLRGADEPDRALLDQVEEREALVPIALRDRHDEAQVRLHHRLLHRVLAALDPLRELDLLGGGEQWDLADVLEEQLQRVGGDLRLRRPRALALVVGGRLHADDLDLLLVEGGVEGVDLGRVQVELVERARELVRVEGPVRAA